MRKSVHSEGANSFHAPWKVAALFSFLVYLMDFLLYTKWGQAMALNLRLWSTWPGPLAHPNGLPPQQTLEQTQVARTFQLGLGTHIPCHWSGRPRSADFLLLPI